MDTKISDEIKLKPCPFCGQEAAELWNRRAGE